MSDTESTPRERSDGEGDGSSRAGSPDHGQLEEYETLMASLLGGPVPFKASLAIDNLSENGGDEEEDEDGDRPMTKADKQNAKKKRRKERERAARAAFAAPAGEGRARSGEGVQGDAAGERVYGMYYFKVCRARAEL